MADQKLGRGIEAYLSAEDDEPQHTFRFSARYPVILLPALLLLTAVVQIQNLLAGKVVLYTSLIFIALLVERRRVCRADLGNFGFRCYNLLGKPFIMIDRATVQAVDLDESVDGKDFYITARGRRYKIPMMYDGFHQMVGILEGWVEENRLSR